MEKKTKQPTSDISVDSQYVKNAMSFLQQVPVWAIVAQYAPVSQWNVWNGKSQLLSNIESFFDFNGKRERKITRDGIEILEVNGVMMRGVDPFIEWLFDLSATDRIIKDFAIANEDNDVNGIVIKLDTPGGDAQGLHDQSIVLGNANKPVLAYTDSLVASAGYYWASAATERSASVDALVGGIGSLSIVVDQTEMLGNLGIRLHEFTTASMKTAFSGELEMTDEKAAYIQGIVEKFGDMFVNDVSKNTGISKKKIVSFDGRCFLGEEALDAGLVDRIETWDQALERFSGECSKKSKGIMVMGDKTDSKVDQKVGDGAASDEPPIKKHESAIAFVKQTVFGQNNGTGSKVIEALSGSVDASGFILEDGSFDANGYATALTEVRNGLDEIVDDAVTKAVSEAALSISNDGDEKQVVLSVAGKQYPISLPNDFVDTPEPKNEAAGKKQKDTAAASQTVSGVGSVVGDGNTSDGYDNDYIKRLRNN